MTPEEFARQLTQARRSGDFQRQIDLLRDSLSVAQQARYADGEAEAMLQLGNVYQELGDIDSAHTWRLAALHIAEQPDAQISDEIRMGIAGGLGRSAIEARDWGEAERHTRTALDLAEQLGHQPGRCIYRINLIWVLTGLNSLAEARQLSQETRTMVLESGDPYLIALYFLNAQSVQPSWGEAVRHAWLCRAFAAELDGPAHASLTAAADLVIGRKYLARSQLTSNLAYAAVAEQALQRAASENPGTHVTSTLELDRALAKMYAQAGRDDQAVTHVLNQLEHLEVARRKLGYEDFQRSFFRAEEPSYEIAVSLLLRQGDAEGAFLAVERARSRLLLAQLGRGPAAWADWTPAERQELRTAAGAYGASAMHALATGAFSPELDKARKRFMSVYDAHRSLRPHWTGFPERGPVTPSQTCALLGPDQALLSYFVTEQATVIFTITAAGLHFQHLPYSRHQAEQDLHELGLAFDAASSNKTRTPANSKRLQTQLERLYAILIAPVLAAVNGAAHWIIVPHHPLHGIPWAGLRGDGRYLVQDHLISTFPSVTFAASSKGGRRAQPGDPGAADRRPRTGRPQQRRF